MRGGVRDNDKEYRSYQAYILILYKSCCFSNVIMPLVFYDSRAILNVLI
jgi:hypothetical protein